MAPAFRLDAQEVTVPYILIGIGGAAGALARFAVDSWVSTRVPDGFPWGTLVINVSGSFVLGLLFVLTVERAVLPSDLRSPLMIGFLGAYTTFSTWMLETWRLVEVGAVGAALFNLGGSTLLGVLALVSGMVIGRAL
jgi:CrcB protein